MWLNSPASTFTCNLSEVRSQIPAFDRRPLSLLQPHDGSLRAHDRLHVIVRTPFGADPDFVPIGVVSSDYTLVSHASLVDAVSRALTLAGLDAENLRADLTLTRFAERMSLAVYLPEAYAYDPGDGAKMALRLECLNSVDGSTRFRVLMGWYRFVCSNGLVVGVTQYEVHQRHVGELDVAAVGDAVSSGIRQAEMDKANFWRWQSTKVAAEPFVKWIEKDLRGVWGFKAATRAFHIAKSGFDVDLVGQFRDQSPTTIHVRRVKTVPGAPMGSTNLFDLSQVLAWLANQRRDVQEQLQWREQIPALLAKLSATR